MPEKCRPCASALLRFRAIYSDLEKDLKHLLIRPAWLVNGVAQRGLPQHLLNEVNEDITKCEKEMEDLKPSMTEDWYWFLTERWG